MASTFLVYKQTCDIGELGTSLFEVSLCGVEAYTTPKGLTPVLAVNSELVKTLSDKHLLKKIKEILFYFCWFISFKTLLYHLFALTMNDCFSSNKLSLSLSLYPWPLSNLAALTVSCFEIRKHVIYSPALTAAITDSHPFNTPLC